MPQIKKAIESYTQSLRLQPHVTRRLDRYDHREEKKESRDKKSFREIFVREMNASSRIASAAEPVRKVVP